MNTRNILLPSTEALLAIVYVIGRTSDVTVQLISDDGQNLDFS